MRDLRAHVLLLLHRLLNQALFLEDGVLAGG
jgi:hypothetical protein